MHGLPGLWKLLEALPAGMRERYRAAESRFFGSGAKRPQRYEESILQTAADMGELVARFGKNEPIAARSSYKAMGDCECEAPQPSA